MLVGGPEIRVGRGSMRAPRVCFPSATACVRGLHVWPWQEAHQQQDDTVPIRPVGTGGVAADAMSCDGSTATLTLDRFTTSLES